MKKVMYPHPTGSIGVHGILSEEVNSVWGVEIIRFTEHDLNYYYVSYIKDNTNYYDGNDSLVK